MFSRRRALVSLLLALGLPTWGCRSTDVASAKPQPPAVAEQTQAVGFDNPGGMWMPTQMAAHAQTLEQLGLAFDPAALSDPTAFPMGAVVSLGGCSASFVSDEGLVVTNHHCVIRQLQHNSTPDANLLEQGFLAATRADEKPSGPGRHIYVTTDIDDVTDTVTGGLELIADPKARYAELEQRRTNLEETCEAARPGRSCSVRSFFEGAEYWLVDALEIRDVRLVYAPHAGIGVFGGEIDNWRWPRHTGDFAMLRAYVGPDGNPADPSPDNVPYVPPHKLTIASAPLQPGDFVMVAGYPGRTNRLSTSSEVRDAMEYRYPRDIERYAQTIELLEQLGKARPELAIKAASRLRRLANYHTNYRGVLEGLKKGALAERKAEQEAALRAWIEASPERVAKYGGAFEELSAIDAEAKATRDRDAVLYELLQGGAMLRAAVAIVQSIDDARPNEDENALAQRTEAVFRDYDAELDRALLELVLTRTAKLPADKRPDDLLAPILASASLTGDATRDEATIEAAVDRLYRKSKLGDPKTRSKLLAAKSLAELQKSKDPFMKVALALRDAYADLRDREEARRGALATVRPKFVAALREWSERPVAPDANGTLRITYGTVKGYRPSPEADVYEPFTTLSQMLAKHTGEEPFALPPALLAAARADKGPYVAAELGDVPVDFLADLDITGGNSGSATLNAKGELVGLAFDGNYEALASDWIFLPGITRSIHVDVRFLLWVLDAVEDGDHLLREMGIEPKLPHEHPATVAAK